jgi:hypothetical protein
VQFLVLDKTLSLPTSTTQKHAHINKEEEEDANFQALLKEETRQIVYSASNF